MAGGGAAGRSWNRRGGEARSIPHKHETAGREAGGAGAISRKDAKARRGGEKWSGPVAEEEPDEEGGEDEPREVGDSPAEGRDQDQNEEGKGEEEEGVEGVGGAEVSVEELMEGAQGAAGGAVESGEGVEGAAGIKGVGGGIKEIQRDCRAKGEEGEDRVGESGCGFVVDGRAEGREENSIFNAQYQYPISKFQGKN